MAAEMANGSGVDQRLPGNLSVLSPASRSTRILKGNARTKEETVALETCRVLYARKDGTAGKACGTPYGGVTMQQLLRFFFNPLHSMNSRLSC